VAARGRRPLAMDGRRNGHGRRRSSCVQSSTSDESLGTRLIAGQSRLWTPRITPKRRGEPLFAPKQRSFRSQARVPAVLRAGVWYACDREEISQLLRSALQWRGPVLPARPEMRLRIRFRDRVLTVVQGAWLRPPPGGPAIRSCACWGTGRSGDHRSFGRTRYLGGGRGRRHDLRRRKCLDGY
jgi:hypothetical protein